MPKLISLTSIARKEARRKMKNIQIVKDNEVVHHKDGNPFNNNLDNLIILTPSEHRKAHYTMGGIKQSHSKKKYATIRDLESLMFLYNSGIPPVSISETPTKKGGPTMKLIAFEPAWALLPGRIRPKCACCGERMSSWRIVGQLPDNTILTLLICERCVLKSGEQIYSKISHG